MESRHVRIDYDEAFESKKQILNCELNLIQIVRRIRAYKILRKKEFKLKNDLKSQYLSLKNMVNSLILTIPEYKEMRLPKKHVESEIKESKDIKKELEEIKNKLARLS